METATEYVVEMEDRPGTLADLLEVLANAGVNIEGFGGSACEGRGTVAFVADNSARAAQALQEAGLSFSTHESLLLNIANEPGAGARVARAMANEGVNLTGGYATLRGQVVLRPDNRTRAEEVARRLGV